MADGDENDSDTTTETDKDIPLADALADLQKGTGGRVGFKRVGGGKGTGWQGAFYNGVEIQLGGPFFFSGSNLETVIRKAMDALGGGEYEWLVQTRKGKIVHGGDPLFFPGEPKKLPGASDPAHDAVEAYNAWVRQQQQSAGSSVYGSAQPATPGLRRVPSGWIWSHGLNAWLWVDEDGNLTPPPPGVRPPQMGPGGGYLSPLHGPSETARDAAAREDAKFSRDLILALIAKGNSGPDLGSIIGPMMTSQASILTAALNAGKSGGSERAEIDLERRKLDKAGYEMVVKQMNATIEHMKATGPGAKSKLEQTLEDAVVKKVAGTILDGDKNDKTDGERIGEKVVDGLTSLVDLGKKWIDKPDKPEKPKEQAQARPQQAPAPPNGHANGQASPPATADDGIDDDTRCWLLILDAGLEAYQTGRSPAQAFEIMYGTMKGAKIKFDKVHEIIRKLTGKQLLTLLDNGSAPVKAAAAPIISAFSTGDGQAWFESLLHHIRQVSVG